MVPHTAAPERAFPLPERLWKAARAWTERERGALAAQARPAASVALVRDGDEGIECFLVASARPNPLGVVRFTGGRVLPEDREPLAWSGADLEAWSTRLGRRDHGDVHDLLGCAVRNLYTETGVMLAERGPMDLVTSSATPDREASRLALADGEVTLREIVERRRLQVRPDLLKPLAHWLSPDFVHHRVSVTFFAATVPVDQQVTPLPRPDTWSGWVDVRRVLETWETPWLGDLADLPETRGRAASELINPGAQTTLEAAGTASSAVAFLARHRRISTLVPRLVEQQGHPVLVVSGCAGADAPGRG